MGFLTSRTEASVPVKDITEISQKHEVEAQEEKAFLKVSNLFLMLEVSN